MPAVTADLRSLPRLPSLPPETHFRSVVAVVPSTRTLEGEGFQVRRPFPGVGLSLADPFLLLDHIGAVEYAPGEAKGTPWHPHRGFETVTYIMDGAFEHQDSTGGGGLITNGATQWMTAGAGILHIEKPPEELVTKGGMFHGVQLWVNLPAAHKMLPPRYQNLESGEVGLVASDDGASLLRIIAGEVGGVSGPGQTFTPITYLHATVPPGSRLTLPWRPDFNALVYALSGEGFAGVERVEVGEGDLAVFGPGQALVIEAAEGQPAYASSGWDVLILGGQAINEPVARYGPFVMNTREEIIQAMEDFRGGRLGQIPAVHL